MDEARYARAKRIFLDACDRTEAERPAFVAAECGSDEEVRKVVLEMLDVDADESPLLDSLAEPTDLDDAETSPPTVPGYRIVRRIGQGGMGSVYLAEQDSPRRRVALKMIRAGYLSRSLRRRFRLEAEVLGRLQHPGIAQIYAAGEIDAGRGSQPFFAMEFVDGVPLLRYAKEHELTIRAKLELVARICDAAHHAHQKGVIHRDLKPDNVLVAPAPEEDTAEGIGKFARLGQPKVLDFGVARATDSDLYATTQETGIGRFIGTIPYMSPEQVSGDSSALDSRSDVYALGVVLFELLSGRLPFDLLGKPIPAAVRIIREEDPARLSSVNIIFRGDVDTIVNKALEKERERRYQSAAELAADLRRYLANEPINAHPPSTFYQFRKFATRNRGLVAGLALAVLFLITGSIVSLVYASIAKQGQREAEQGNASAQRAANRAHLAAAQALGRNDIGLALSHLEQIPERDRGWEWHHVHAQTDLVAASRTGGLSREEWERVWVPGEIGRLSCLARRPDGRVIAALLRENGVDLVDLESGELWATVQDEEPLTAPNLSPDGSHLCVLAKRSGVLRVWDVERSRQVLELPLGTTDPDTLRLSPGGKRIALPSGTDGVRVLDVESGRGLFRAFPHDSTFVYAVAFDPRGERLAVATTDGYQFRVHLTSNTGVGLATSPILTGAVFCLAFSPDGTQLAVGQAAQTLSLLDADSLEIQQHIGVERGADAVAYSPDGAYLASTYSDGGSVRIWDLVRDEIRCDLPRGQTTSLMFSQDNTFLAGGSPVEAKLWEWARRDSRVLRGGEDYMYFAVFSPDGSLLATKAFWGEHRLWDAGTGASLGTLPGYEWINGLHAFDFTPDGALLVIGPVFHWDTGSGALVPSPGSASESPPEGNLPPPLLISYIKHHAGIARGGARAQIHASNFITDGERKRLAELHGREIIISELSTDRELVRLTGDVSRYYDAEFDSAGERLVTGDEDGGITVWDLNSGMVLATMTGHTGKVYSVTFSPDDTRIASGGEDGNIFLWDAATFDRVMSLEGHLSYVHSVRFSPDGTQLASASGDHTVRLWDSLPLSERYARTQAARALREEMAPLVDRLLEELTDPQAVAEHLRGDAERDEDSRRAALRVLLERSLSAD